MSAVAKSPKVGALPTAPERLVERDKLAAVGKGSARDPITNEVAPLIGLESFAEFAFQELEDCPMHEPGICAWPACSKPFKASRPWARYCSPQCKQADMAEYRKFGMRVAAALLAHRMGKYEKTNEPLKALSRAGRRYFSEAQSSWFEDRQRRIQAALKSVEGSLET